MAVIVVDVEADGPIPSVYSRVCFGAIVVEPGLNRTFYGKTKPISPEWLPDALAVSGFSREQHEKFGDPEKVMGDFHDWIIQVGASRSTFVSDNLAFDWQWINWYFHFYLGTNPFGFSGRRIGDLYAGLTRDFSAASAWKKLRQTRHSHNPVDDARGNAEALLQIGSLFDKFPFK